MNCVRSMTKSSSRINYGFDKEKYQSSRHFHVLISSL